MKASQDGGGTSAIEKRFNSLKCPGVSAGRVIQSISKRRMFHHRDPDGPLFRRVYLTLPFLADIVVNQPRGKEIHVIADNLSAHKTVQVEDFLDRHRNVHLHFTPTYSSWLNQIELWFAKIERDVIARGVFTSLADLRRKLMKYIRHYNKVPKTVKWRYFDPTRRITLSSAVTGH